ncbi:MAG: SIS domain-containing protein [Candidatus Aenigmarchaeota archaeon]|nr:SIS domain-containing protein [Candidatus Aenigmarchaeota archaeon]
MHKELIAVMENVNVKNILDGIIAAIVDCYKNNGKVVVFGNGGSAADAQHIAAELQGKLKIKRPGLAAIALSTNTSTITAVGNDFGFDFIFEKQVEGFVQNGDVVIGISTSGNSPNILNGLVQAKKQGAIVVFFTGKTGGMTHGVSQKTRLIDFELNIPTTSTQRIQEGHELCYHTICEAVEEEIFGATNNNGGKR